LSTPQVNAIEDCSILWHKQLGHLIEKGLIALARQGLLSSGGTSLQTYFYCLVDKQYKVSFLIYPPSRRPHILYLIHNVQY